MAIAVVCEMRGGSSFNMGIAVVAKRGVSLESIEKIARQATHLISRYSVKQGEVVIHSGGCTCVPNGIHYHYEYNYQDSFYTCAR